MITDVHAHGLSEDFIIEAAKGGGWKIEIAGPRRYVAPDYGVLDPLLYDCEGRIASLRARGIGLQLVSPAAAARRHSRPRCPISNSPASSMPRRLASSRRRRPVRRSGRAGLLGSPRGAADELRRAVIENGFRGVLLPTSANGVPLDDAAFEPLLAAIEDLDLLAFLHPVSSRLSAGLPDYTLAILIGWPTETSVAVTRLIFAGVLERHPRLKLVLAHGGGTLPCLLGRIDLGYSAPNYEANPACRANISRPPSHYLKQLYFDTTVTDPKALAFLIEQMGCGPRAVRGAIFPMRSAMPTEPSRCRCSRRWTQASATPCCTAMPAA